jgi:hypothetical protein
MSTFPNGFATGVSVQNIPILNTYPGRVFWLDSVNGSDTNKGTFARPFGTLMGAQYALQQQAPSVFNDILMVKPGHQETITAPRTVTGAPIALGGTATAGSMSLDFSGLQIIGLGIGDDRPRITFTTTTTGVLNITGSNVAIQNFLFLGNFASIATAVHVGGTTAGTGLASVTGYIAGNIMTVTALASGYLYPGSTLWSVASGFLRGTKIVNQITGTAGGVGTYYVNYSQTVGSVSSTQTITSVARGVALLNNEFRDLSSSLGFLAAVRTSAVANAIDGFSFLGNTWNGLSTSALSAVVQNANADFVNISQNQINLAANNGNATLLAKSSAVNKGLFVFGNRCYRPNSTNTGGQLISTTSTTDTGQIVDNYQVGGTASTGLLIPTGTGLGFQNNYIQQVVDKSGILLPASA